MSDAETEHLQSAFIAEVIAAFERHGRPGAFLRRIRWVMLVELPEPDARSFPLNWLFKRWLRASPEERWKLTDNLARKRFGSAYRTARADLLTDNDINWRAVHCCGNEHLAFLRCLSCGRVWIECYGCETWHLEPTNPEAEGEYVGDRKDCPYCGVVLPITEDDVDAVLPTREQVVSAGLGRFITREE